MAQLLCDVDMEEERELQVLESRMPRVAVGRCCRQRGDRERQGGCLPQLVTG